MNVEYFLMQKYKDILVTELDLILIDWQISSSKCHVYIDFHQLICSNRFDVHKLWCNWSYIFDVIGLIYIYIYQSVVIALKQNNPSGDPPTKYY